MRRLFLTLLEIITKATTNEITNNARAINWSSLICVGATYITPIIIIVNTMIKRNPNRLYLFLLLIFRFYFWWCKVTIIKWLILDFLNIAIQTLWLFWYLLCKVAYTFTSFSGIGLKGVFQSCVQPQLLMLAHLFGELSSVLLELCPKLFSKKRSNLVSLYLSVSLS